MSCQACERFKASGMSSGFRWKNANIEIRGCDEHRAEMFAALRLHITRDGKPSVFDELVDACMRVHKELICDSEISIGAEEDLQAALNILKEVSELPEALPEGFSKPPEAER